jgi:hypothetical protein
MVGTGVGAYVQYGYESAFKTEQTTRDKPFGMNQKVTSLRTSSGKIELPQLAKSEIQDFAYGAKSWELSMEWVLSNPFWLKALMGGYTAPTETTAPYLHVYTGNALNLQSMSVEVGFDTDTDVVRVLLGTMMKSATISATLDNTVNVSATMVAADEKTIGATLDTTPAADTIAFPYTFVQGSLEMPDGTALTQIQSVELTIDNSAEVLKALNSAVGVAGYKKLVRYSGSFSGAVLTKSRIQDVLDQASGEKATMALKFTTGSGATLKEIDIVGTTVAFDENTVRYEAGEPVFEDTPFQIASVTINAKNAEADDTP